MSGGLSREQVDEFCENGFLILKDVFKPEECQGLRNECRKLVDDYDISQHPMVRFTTGDNQVTNQYFMTSGDKIRFFFEQEAFDKDGNLNYERYKAVNKIGHALHALNPAFKAFTFDKRVQDLIRSIGMKKPAVCQSMYIFKQAGIGGEVACHQDATYLFTTPINVVGVWIALEECTTENGCLKFLPGSHKDGVKRRFIRNPSESEFATTLTGELVDYDMSKFVDAQVKAGSVLLIHGEVVHYSFPNKSDKSRNIYTFHVVEQENTEWSKENWLQPSESLPFVPMFTN